MEAASHHQRCAESSSGTYRCAVTQARRDTLRRYARRPSGNGSKNNWRCCSTAFILQLESRRGHGPTVYPAYNLRYSTRLGAPLEPSARPQVRCSDKGQPLCPSKQSGLATLDVRDSNQFNLALSLKFSVQWSRLAY